MPVRSRHSKRHARSRSEESESEEEEEEPSFQPLPPPPRSPHSKLFQLISCWTLPDQYVEATHSHTATATRTMDSISPNNITLKNPNGSAADSAHSPFSQQALTTLPPAPPLSTRMMWSSSLLVMLCTFCVYHSTCYRYLSGGDSGELAIAAANLGVAHPPGYPLQTMLAALSIRLPSLLNLSDSGCTDFIAYRIAVLCCLLGALSAAFLHLVVLRLTHSIPCGVLAGLGFAFSPTVWLYSVQGEVFALNNLLLTSMMNLLVIYLQHAQNLAQLRRELRSPGGERPTSVVGAGEEGAASQSDLVVREQLARDTCLRWARWGAFTCGLALTNQHTSICYVLPTVIFVLLTLHALQLLDSRLFKQLTACFLIGLLPYVYLPIASSFRPVDSWGDQTSIWGFFQHILRREYGTFQLARSSLGADPGVSYRLRLYTSYMFSELLYVGAFLALVGVVALSLTKHNLRSVQLPFVSGYLFYLAVFHSLANLNSSNLLLVGVQMRFWIQANLYVFLWAGIGTHYILRLLSTWIARCKHAMNRWRSSAHIELTGSASSLNMGQTAFSFSPFCCSALSSSSCPSSASSSSSLNSSITSPASSSSSVSRTSVLSSLCSSPSSTSTGTPLSTLTQILLWECAILFVLIQCVGNYRARDHSDTRFFKVIGETALQAFPNNSIVFANGDLNHVLLKYPHECVHLREDLRLINLQLWTWKWFITTQALHLPGVEFPDAFYHPAIGGFSLKEFLDLNVGRFRIFLCGPFRELDHSHVGFYEAVPFGLCEELLPIPPSRSFDRTRWVHSWYVALPSSDSLGPFISERHPESWEHLAFAGLYARRVFLGSLIAVQSSLNTSNEFLADEARKAADTLFDGREREKTLLAMGVLSANDYKWAGVMYGIWSSFCHRKGNAVDRTRYERRMIRLAKGYRALVPESKEFDDVLSGHNPYIGRKIGS